jgi:hypothetical protein
MSKDRKARRAKDRETVKDARQRLRLALLEPGGSAERPLGVATSHLVEPVAASMPCPVCGGSVRVLEHVVQDRLRVAHVQCSMCNVARSIYFRIEALQLN